MLAKSVVLVFLYLLVTLFQAGGMERASKLPRMVDVENESTLGYVFGVSGPGMY